MRSTPSRRTTVSTAVALSLGVVIAGGVSTAAHAEQNETMVRAAVTTSMDTGATLAPFVSEEAAALSTEPLDDIVEEAETARDDAAAAIADADAAEKLVAKKVEKKKLKVSGPTTIDTAALEDQVEQLDTIAVTPVLLLPAATADADGDTAAVEKATASLLTRLDKAEKKRAAEIAAAKAAKEAARKAAEEKAAQEAAARAAEESSSSSSGSSGGSVSSGSPASSGDNSVAGAQATARSLAEGRGWGSDQFSCLVKLWNKESGWNYQAYNASSGAYGIPQALPGSKMASAGGDWKTSAATQIRWGLGYIDGRYGSPCGAWEHSQSVGWY